MENHDLSERNTDGVQHSGVYYAVKQVEFITFGFFFFARGLFSRSFHSIFSCFFGEILQETFLHAYPRSDHVYNGTKAV